MRGPRDRNAVLWLLGGVWYGSIVLLRGKRTHWSVTLLARLAALFIILGATGSIWWHALLTMPIPVAVFFGSAMVVRVVRWYLRRQP